MDAFYAALQAELTPPAAEAKTDPVAAPEATEVETPAVETEVEADEAAKAEKKDEAADAPEEPDADEPEKEADERPKKKSGINRLKERVANLEAENATLRSRAPDSADVSAAVEKAVGAPPKEADFNGDYLAYERAQTVYEVKKALAEGKVQEQLSAAQQRQQAAQIAAIEAFQDAEDEVRKAIPDYDKHVRKMAGAAVAPHVGQLVLESDKGALLKLHFAQNPEVLERLNRSNPLNAAREIGRIEARLSLPKPKTVTKAPAPVSSPRGGAAPSNPDKDIDAYLAKTYRR